MHYTYGHVTRLYAITTSSQVGNISRVRAMASYYNLRWIDKGVPRRWYGCQSWQKSKRISTTICFLHPCGANICGDDLVNSEWNVILQSNCHSSRIMDVVKGGIQGNGPLTVERRFPIWGGFVLHFFMSNTIQDWCGMKLMEEQYCGLKVNWRRGGPQESWTWHMTTMAMQSMKID